MLWFRLGGPHNLAQGPMQAHDSLTYLFPPFVERPGRMFFFLPFFIIRPFDDLFIFFFLDFPSVPQCSASANLSLPHIFAFPRFSLRFQVYDLVGLPKTGPASRAAPPPSSVDSNPQAKPLGIVFGVQPKLGAFPGNLCLLCTSRSFPQDIIGV